MSELVIFSIGHSNHEVNDFIDLLQSHQVSTLVDVRSQPYSRWVPAYNRESLDQALSSAGLDYYFLGQQLGGRPDDTSLYEPGSQRPDYQRVAKTSQFQSGLDRLMGLARESVVAFMCSEGDYHECHRSVLITPELLALGARVMHILPDGRTVEADMPARQLGLF